MSPQNWWEVLGICCLSHWCMFRVKILRACGFFLWRNLLPWAVQDTTTATCQDLSEQLSSTSGRRTKQEITLPLSDVNLRTGKATDLAGFLSLSETQAVLELLGWWPLLLLLLLLLQGLVDDLKGPKNRRFRRSKLKIREIQCRFGGQRLGKIEEVQSQD